MNPDVVKTLRAEQEVLLRRINAIRDVLAAYGETEDDRPARQSAKTAETVPDPRSKRDIRGFTEQTRTSVVLAMRCMLTQSGLTRTRDLVKYIESQGYEITGKNKVNALGALLARSIDVVSHGKSGWTLADPHKAMEIVAKYGPKENEPSSENAAGSDAGTEGAPTPTYPWIQPSDQSAYS